MTAEDAVAFGRRIGEKLQSAECSALKPTAIASAMACSLLAACRHAKLPAILAQDEVADWMRDNGVTASHLREALAQARREIREREERSKPAKPRRSSRRIRRDGASGPVPGVSHSAVADTPLLAERMVENGPISDL